EGGYTVWGKLVPAERNLAESAIPIGLAHYVRLLYNIVKGEIVHWGRCCGVGHLRHAPAGRWNSVLRRRQSRPGWAQNNRGRHMEYRRFGRTDLKVSAIGFGCWEIGGTYGQIDDSEFQRAVAQGIDNGVTCFDTAEAYGMGISEEALARALGGRSKGVVIATKFGVGY